MQYPRDFSPEARARVEAERLRATREYVRKRDELPSGYGSISEHKENLRSFIMRVFLAFAKEACNVGLDGVWTVDRIRSEADEFLRGFTIEAYYQYGHDSMGRKLPEMTSEWGRLRPEVEREFRNCSEWHQYEDELLAVADRIAKGAISKREKVPSAAANTTRRSDIEIFPLA